MSSASIHDKLSRVRKPRVHITYKVETEGADTGADQSREVRPASELRADVGDQ